FVAQNSSLKVIEGQFAEEKYAIAVKKGNTELLNKLNKAMQKLIDDGTLADIIAQYNTAV
ncbi:MAG TPA: transporter substrate-binding domain-containing protein, partial [Clostridia bacterium]|nr:transporter substrate-binding domain-containing protein [Clostridia bacterium]